MAIAEKTLASQFNKHDNNIIDHRTYVFTGDGCLMEESPRSLFASWHIVT